MMGVILVAITWGSWELFDLLFIDDGIESVVRIVPEIRLEINNNKVDTIYYYLKP